MTQYIGITFSGNSKSNYAVSLDVSLTAVGSAFSEIIYTLDISYQFVNYSIDHLKIPNIIAASKILGYCWKYEYIQIFVTILQSYKSYKLAKPEMRNYELLPEISGC